MDAITTFIQLDTFSSFWYWAAVAVSWAGASHWLIGVPFDVLYYARRGDAQRVSDLEALVDVNVRRIMFFDGAIAMVFAALVAFFLTFLAVLGFVYEFEVAQGMFILGGPLTIVMIMNMHLAYQLREQPLEGELLVKKLFRTRLWTQVIGMISIFLTSVYGMYFVLSSGFFS